MDVQGGEDVYASLLLNDAYLPGALVLAHSLRDGGTKKKLAVLVTVDTVSADVIAQLKAVYDYVIPVPRIRNEKPANLGLMKRLDLHSAFTKVNLWKQTQFRKIVYVDADVVALRAPDELFDLPYAFAAAPDIGWPDLFNTGVMVLTPNLGDYYALMAMAERGISFDGADQGLLNMYFKDNYHRLSFTYNVTPSAHYQYIPAYKHFQSSINMVHFIGPAKPWFQGRYASVGDTPFDKMVGRWWAVYDRHYRAPSTTRASPAPSQAGPSQAPAYQPRAQTAPPIVQYFVKGEYQPSVTQATTGEQYRDDHEHHPPYQPPQGHDGSPYQPSGPLPPPPPQPPQPPQPQPYPHHEHVEHRHDGHPGHHEHHEHHEYREHHDHGHRDHVPRQEHYEHHHEAQLGPSFHEPEPPRSGPSESFVNVQWTSTEARKDQVQEDWVHHPAPEPGHKQPEPRPPPMSTWDAQWQPPPVDSRPEALNFPQEHYEMSQDTAPFIPPERYPTPPRDMWYEVPKEPPAPPSQKPKPIFPWEGYQPKPTRVFTDMEPPPPRPSEPEQQQQQQQQQPGDATSEPTVSFGSRAPAEPSVTGPSTVERRSEPSTPPPVAAVGPPPWLTAPPPQMSLADPWSSFPRTNAWDEVPEIERYVDSLMRHRRRSSGPGKLRPLGVGAPGYGGGFGEPGGMYYDDEEEEEEEEEDDGSRQFGGPLPWRRRGSIRLTDFPSEVERPSLPVTPAPVRREMSWGPSGPLLGFGAAPEHAAFQGGEYGTGGAIPAAAGVPSQSDWLQKLAREQSEMLMRRFGRLDVGHGQLDVDDGGEAAGGQPPWGEEDVTTAVRGRGAEPSNAALRQQQQQQEQQQQRQKQQQEEEEEEDTSAMSTVESQTYVASGTVLSPRPVKGVPAGGPIAHGGLLRGFMSGATVATETGEPAATTADDTTPRSAPSLMDPVHIEEPSYHGPGAVWERGEEYPTMETPALPTEEERDVLET